MQRFALAAIGLFLGSQHVRAQNVTVVTNLMSLQTAIAAATDGDILLLQPGSIPSSTQLLIDGKSLTIASITPLRQFISGPLTVSNLGPGQTVVLRHIEISSYTGGPGLVVANCAGAVHVEDCSLIGNVYFGGDPGLRLNSAQAVTVVDSTIRGSDGSSGGGPYGGPGIVAIGSSLRLHNCDVRGARTLFAQGPAALSFTANAPTQRCEVTQCTLTSGQGCGPGPALFALGPVGTEILLVDSTLQSGPANAGCGTTALVSSIPAPVVRSVGERSLTVPIRATWGGTWTSTLRGAPGQLAVVVLDWQPRGLLFRICDSFGEVDPIAGTVLSLGVTDAGGVLTWTQPIAPAALAGMRIHIQGALFDAVACRVTAPHSALVLGPQF